MKKEALKLWMGLPLDKRQLLLSNVWCGECRKSVTIVDYHAELHGVVVLQGFCGTCGHKVASVIDDLAPTPQKKPKVTKRKGKVEKPYVEGKPVLWYYIFNVWLYGDYPPTKENRIIRKIQIAKTKSLYNFAKVITQAFDFYFDHCFGFYSDFNRPQNSKKAYELFYDLDDVELPAPHVKSVKRTKIQQVFKQPGDKMLFLFDYGDGWQFSIELKEIMQAEKWDLKPVILESVGKAPLQYPPCEDEEIAD
ncbi:MAG: hypothetical protein P9M13_03645 [Candidatus Ancaeobacter aquaticus]|nr:hypothetical protein [Candidatus Ancaeobacter aquaticus]